MTSTAISMELMRVSRSRADVIADLFDAAQGYVGDRWRLGEATAEDELLVSEAIATSMKALPEPLWGGADAGQLGSWPGDADEALDMLRTRPGATFDEVAAFADGFDDGLPSCE